MKEEARLSLVPVRAWEVGLSGSCWTCDFVRYGADGEADVKWDLTRLGDRSWSAEDICEGESGTQEWVEELELDEKEEPTSSS